MLLNASDAVWFASANSLSASELKPTMNTACRSQEAARRQGDAES